MVTGNEYCSQLLCDLRPIVIRDETMKTLAWARRAVVAVMGFTVLLIGLAMIVLPGPAILVIPLGLAILATEFVWARRLLQRTRATLTSSVQSPKLRHLEPSDKSKNQ